jgi:hypothetical protein
LQLLKKIGTLKREQSYGKYTTVSSISLNTTAAAANANAPTANAEIPEQNDNDHCLGYSYCRHTHNAYPNTNTANTYRTGMGYIKISKCRV